MPAFLSELLSQVRAIWARLDGGQRLIVSVVMLATVAGLGAIVWFAGRPDYRPVFSSLEPRELAQAMRALDQASIPYKIEGGAVVVESGEFDPARAALVSSGVAAGVDADPGQLSQMTSDRETRLHALARMVERDAERKLLAIQGVLHAQVSHSKPKRSPYQALDEETRPRAHVGVRVAPGVSFAAVANAAIHEASAALGIPPEHVTVTNLATMQTHGLERDGSSSLDTSEFLAQQRRRSEELTARAQSLLDRLYPERAVVRVSVVLDPAWTMTRERGAPDKQLVKKTTTTKENTVDPQAVAASGDPSALGEPAAAVGTAQATTTHKKEQKETEYAADGFKEVSSGRLAPDVKKMTVALVVDDDVVADAGAEQQLRDLVKNAIGWSDDWATDGDFTVLKAALPDLPEPAAPSLPGFLSLLDRYGAMAGQVLAVLLVLLFLRALLKRHAGPAANAVPQAVAADAAAESAEQKTRRARREIERAIADDPAAVSRLLESWLSEPKP